MSIDLVSFRAKKSRKAFEEWCVSVWPARISGVLIEMLDILGAELGENGPIDVCGKGVGIRVYLEKDHLGLLFGWHSSGWRMQWLVIGTKRRIRAEVYGVCECAGFLRLHAGNSVAQCLGKFSWHAVAELPI